jgi:glycosyltransferase involved in cell wall biosynthesis
VNIALIANTDWYLYNFRRGLALALQRQGHSVFLISPPGPYARDLTALGLRWLPLKLNRRGLNLLADARAVFELRDLLKKYSIDITHAFTLKGVVCSASASVLAGIDRRVHGIDGLGYVFSSKSWKAMLLKPAVKLALGLSFKGKLSRLIVQNQDDAKLFNDASMIVERSIRIIRGAGVDCVKYSVCGVRAPGQPLRVLLASRLLVDKGILEFVKAARTLRKEGRNIEFLLAGAPDPGNPESVSEHEVRGWVVEGSVSWLGQVSDMPALLATVHAVTLPSFYREGLPTCLTEAAACGLPLITTDNPGCREVVSHLIDGLLIPIRDADALAEAIAMIDDNPSLAEQLGRAAQAKARIQFDERIIIEQTLAVYDELIPMPAQS